MLIVQVAKAQQDAMYSQYMFNMLAINPAYAGSREVISITALGRRQWVGVEGAPQSQTITADMPIRNKGLGIGLQLFNDQVGITKNSGAFGSCAYRIRMRRSVLAFAMQGGLEVFRARLSGVAVTNPNRGNQNLPSDPAFSADIVQVLPNVGAGVFYSNDKFYWGLSIPHLLNNNMDNIERSTLSKGRATQYHHLFFTTGMVFPVSDQVKLKPSLLVKGVRGAPIQLDVNANVWLRDVIALGLSYRTGDAMVGMAEVQLNQQFRLGYAYDWAFSRLGRYHGGSHELMLRYEFGKEKEKMVTPRYF